MKNEYLKRKNRAVWAIAAICVLLTLACITATCLPHAHFDSNAHIDCPICTFVRLLAGAVLTAAIGAICAAQNGGICSENGNHPCLRLCREFTPVWRKVKLSN